LSSQHLRIDCGAGIGRVSKFFLLPEFDHVDLIEQSERLLRGSFNYVRIPNLQERMRHLFCMGLQDFDPTPNTYDVIWIQWVLPHLHDLDLVNFLRKCQQALRPNGWICIKENVILEGTPFEIDKEDSSVTRSEAYYKSIFEQAGLELIHEKKQQGFPDELYPVKMYALI
jgi:protein N-terminal methyltransferase